jgi:hypothetical protein
MCKPGVRILLKPRPYSNMNVNLGIYSTKWWVKSADSASLVTNWLCEITKKTSPEGQKRARRGDSYEAPLKHK